MYMNKKDYIEILFLECIAQLLQLLCFLHFTVNLNASYVL